MRKLEKRTLSFMLAAIFALLPMAGTVADVDVNRVYSQVFTIAEEAEAPQAETEAETETETETETDEDTGNVQGAQHYVTMSTQSTEVGQSVTLSLNSSVAATGNNDACTFSVKLSGDLLKTTNDWFDENHKTMTIITANNKRIDFELDGDTIKYKLNPGDTVNASIHFTVPNGVSGQSVTITATPGVVSQGNLEKLELGGAVSTTWTGNFGWEDVKKTVTSTDDSTFMVTKDGDNNIVQGEVEYTISAQSQNTDPTGEVWTDYVTLTDTLTLPDHVSLPDDATVVGNRVVIPNGAGAEDDEVIFELTSLPANSQVSYMYYNPTLKQITFRVVVDNPRNESNVPITELDSVELKAKLHMEKLVLTDMDNANAIIPNRVNFVADAYNSTLVDTSNAETPVSIVGAKDDATIQKDANPTSVAAGDAVTYTITVENKGQGATEPGNPIVDTLPIGMKLTDEQIEAIRTDITNNGCTSVTIAQNQNGQYVITWLAPAIRLEKPLTLTYQATVESADKLTYISSFYNTAWYNSSIWDSATVTYKKPSLTLTKANNCQNVPVAQDKVVTYTLTAQETGDAAGKFTLTDVLPNHLTLTDAQGNPLPAGTYENFGATGLTAVVSIDRWGGVTTIVWKDVDFTAKETKTLTVYAKPTDVNNMNTKYLKNQFYTDGGYADSTIEVIKDSLQLKKEAGQTTVQVGDTINYTLTIENPIIGKTVTDHLPSYIALKIGDKVYKETTDSGEIELGGKKCYINVAWDGSATITWAIDDTWTEDQPVIIEYQVEVAHADGLSNGSTIANRVTSSLGDDETAEVTVEKPQLTVAKTYDDADKPENGYRNNDVIKFTMTTYVDADGADAKGVKMTDKLPNGMELVADQDGNPVTGTYSANYTVFSNENDTVGTPYTADCEVVENTDGTTSITCTATETIPAGGRIEWVLYAKIKNTGAAINNKLTNYFTVDNNYAQVQVPVDKRLTHEKKVLVGGELADFSTITEGSTVTYVLTLTNGNESEATFTGVVDELPATYKQFTYAAGNSSYDVAGITVERYGDSDGFGSATWSIDGPDGNGNYKIKWDDIKVPGGESVTEQVTITFPSGDVWSNYVNELAKQNNGLTVSNKFVYDGNYKVVDHRLDVPKQVYMQKGVFKLAGNKANSTQVGSYTGTSTSLSRYDAVDGEFVIYYIAVVNPGNTDVVLKSIDDKLPDGLTYKGLVNPPAGNGGKVDDLYGPAVSMTTPSGYNPRLASVRVNGVLLANGDIVQAPVAGSADGQNVTIQIDDAVNGFTLGAGKAIMLGYLCEINPKATQASSTNMATLHVAGQVSRGEAIITSTSPEGLAANDGSCSVEYDAEKDETKLQSFVTISPAPVTGEVYAQKGVCRLNNMVPEYSTKYDEEKQSSVQVLDGYSSSQSGAIGTSKYHFEKGYTVVEYYFTAVNTGNNPIEIHYAVDKLPEGVTFVGMKGNWGDTWSVKVDANGNTLNKQNLDNSEPLSISAWPIFTKSGFEWQYATWDCIPVVATGTVVNDTTKQEEITFNFNNGNGIALQPGYGMGFTYVCVVKDSVNTKSTNVIELVSKGALSVGQASITTNTEGGSPNDGRCKFKEYIEEKDQTIVSSEVSIYPTTGDVIIPGITKQVTGIIRGNNRIDYSASDLRGTDTLEWTITLYNDGTISMPIEYVEDVIDYPYTLVEGASANLTFYRSDGTTETVTLTVPKGETMNPEGADIDKQTKYTFNLNNQYSIGAGEHAVLVLQTVNGTGVQVMGEHVNKATLKPESNFSYYSNGTGAKADNASTTDPYVTVYDSDSVIVRQEYSTVSSKRVEDVDDSDNVATSQQATTAADNYITIQNKEGVVEYMLTVQNDGYTPLSTFGLIDNMPEPNDRGTIVGNRGSEFTVKLLTEPKMTVYNSEDTPVTGISYKLEYSQRTSGFTNADYVSPDAPGWNARFEDAKSFRIYLTEGALNAGDRVEVTFRGVIQNDAEPGLVAWNTFAYRYEGATSQLNAAPPRVGVAIKQTDVNLEFDKVDGDGNRLEGASFALYNITEDKAGEEPIDRNPIYPKEKDDANTTHFTFEGLVEGTYKLEEVTAPGGYLGGGQWVVDVYEKLGKLVVDIGKVGGSGVTVTQPATGQFECQIVNQKPPALPSTGGAGTAWYTMAGLGLMLLALLGSRRLRVRAAKGGR